MPQASQRSGPHHRRALSDTSFHFAIGKDDDDFLLFDPSDVDLSSIVADLSPPPGSASRPVPMAIESDDSSSVGARRARPPANHFRSLSVDSDFFDGLNLGSASKEGSKMSSGAETVGVQMTAGLDRHSASMDGFNLPTSELDSALFGDGFKKAMATDRLAELALIDPKRAKRIIANRQSAARSKERKVRYTNELERKVQTLQSEATSLSAQVTMLQRDTTGLTTENKELKLRLQAMEQQAHLIEALNDALREEIQVLKIAAGQFPVANGSAPNRGLPPQYSPFGSLQNQNHNQQQQLLAPRSSSNAQIQTSEKGLSNYGQVI